MMNQWTIHIVAVVSGLNVIILAVILDYPVYI